MTHKISVLLPIYNGVRFLSEQVQSILAQTHADLELLTVDDGSSDGSAELITEFASRDRRIVNVMATGNRGQKRRLRDLVKLATGDFIAFSDQDDVWHEKKLEVLLAGSQNHGLAFGRSNIIDENGEVMGHDIFDAVGVAPKPELRLRSLVQPLVSAHALIVRREQITESVFNRSMPFDWMLCLEASFSSGVIYLPEAIVYHRMHGSNQTNGALRSARVRSFGSRIPLPREIMQSGARDRFQFWNMLDFLGHSELLETETSRMFEFLASSCADVWFVNRDKPFQRRTVLLREILTEGLEPLAGSEEDWMFCSKAIAILTSPTRPIGLDDLML